MATGEANESAGYAFATAYGKLQYPHKNDRILTLNTHEQVGKVN